MSHGWVAHTGSYRPLPGEGPADVPEDGLRVSDLVKLARRGSRRLAGAARAEDRPGFPRLIAEHLGVPPEQLDVVEESWPAYELVNVQLGIDAWLATGGRTHELVGLRNHRHRQFGLTDLMSPEDPWDHGPAPGSVSWTTRASGPDGQVMRAVRAGLYLVEDAGTRLALLVVGADEESGRPSLQLHVVASEEGAAAQAAADVRRLAIEHNVYRGQLVSFGGSDMFGERAAALQFHSRPDVPAETVILPPETLATIRRQVVSVAAHRDALLAAGQHLKRGLLLYGPPGVGKTHTVRHLVSELRDVTIVRLTGDALELIGTACAVARNLQPAMVVVEDVDLIAEDREMGRGAHPLLFELLNEMDGLAEDADVVFLLTTNRADVLEPALAARPGRVDQAVALELPDRPARERLLELYRGELDLDTSRLGAVLERTEGVTASFLKELLRRAALVAAEASEPGSGGLAVSADHLDAALDELLDSTNAMTRVLLGAGNAIARPAGAAGFGGR